MKQSPTASRPRSYPIVIAANLGKANSARQAGSPFSPASCICPCFDGPGFDGQNWFIFSGIDVTMGCHIANINCSC